MTEDTVLKLAHHLPNLTHLDLSYCITAVTDNALQAIFQHQVCSVFENCSSNKLYHFFFHSQIMTYRILLKYVRAFQIWIQHLKLSGCNRITDAGLTGMVRPASMAFTAITSNSPMNHFNESSLSSSIKSKLRISLKSRAEEEIVRDAERKKAILQLFEDALPSSSASGFSLSRLKGTFSFSKERLFLIHALQIFYFVPVRSTSFEFIRMHKNYGCQSVLCLCFY